MPAMSANRTPVSLATTLMSVDRPSPSSSSSSSRSAVSAAAGLRLKRAAKAAAALGPLRFFLALALGLSGMLALGLYSRALLVVLFFV